MTFGILTFDANVVEQIGWANNIYKNKYYYIKTTRQNTFIKK